MNWKPHIFGSKQGKSEGFDSCNRPSDLTKFGFKFFSPCDPEIWWMTSSTLHQALCIISNPSVDSNWSYCPETLASGQNRQLFVLCDLEVWWMTLKDIRAPLLCCIKLCASFQSHRWIQTGVTVRKRSIRVKIGDLLSRVTLKFDRWPWKIIGHLFYATWSFVHHFLTIDEFKLELQSRNAQIGQNLFFYLCDLDLWTWTLTFCMNITFVNGNNSWKFHDDPMTGTLTDGRTEVFLELLGRS